MYGGDESCTTMGSKSTAARRRQRQRRRQRKNSRATTNTSGANGKGKRARTGVVRSTRRVFLEGAGRGLSPAGEQFLKCAIAPKDFPGLRAGGVPDEYAGPSFTLRHSFLETMSVTPGTGRQWFAVLPTPGVAFWYADTPAGPWKPKYYPEFASLFGDSSDPTFMYGTINVERFRYVSQIVEVKFAGQVLNAQGTLTAARMPGIEVNEQVEPGTASVPNAVSKYITGLITTNQSDIASMPGFYTGNVIKGLFGWSVNEGGSWDFNPIWMETLGLNTRDNDHAAGPFLLDGEVMGWGNIVPIVFCQTGSNDASALSINVECCIEYCPRSSSLMARMSAPSPAHDPVALELYSKAGKNLAAFVPADENDGFWDKFLNIVSSVSGFLAPVLGPRGKLIAGGISALTSGIRSLII